MQNKFKNNIEPAGSLKNKTGEWRNFRPVVDKEKCIACGACERNCPEGCIVKRIKNKELGIKNNEPQGGSYFYEADLDYCKGCGICAEVCPVKCILMKGEK